MTPTHNAVLKTPAEITTRTTNDWFGRFAPSASGWLGSKWAFAGAGLVIVIWAATGPVFHFSDTWQLVINTGTTIVTFLMVFLIQNTQNRDLTQLPLSERREILASVLKPNDHVNLSETGHSAAKMLTFVLQHGLEGVIAKRSDSIYEPGKRSGLWSKHRISLGQEFVIGGYIPSNLGLDLIIVGFYRGKDLIYASRVRAGFVPATRRKVFDQIKHLTTPRCPFANLPEAASGRWGQGLTA